MSSAQISYPVRLLLQTQEDKRVLSLKKGPQRETVTLEGYKVKLLRNSQSLQPVIITSEESRIRSLTLWIPLGDRWTPLIKKEEAAGFASMFFKNAQNSVMQIFMAPRDKGVIRLELVRNGRFIKICWLLERKAEKGKDLTLAPVQISVKDRKVEPVHYTLKDPAPAGLKRGRLLRFESQPSKEQIRRDISMLSESKCTFDFYMIDYGMASQWGDWDKPAPWIGDNFSEITDGARSLGAVPGIRLSPLTCSRKSDFYRNRRHLLLEKGTPLKIKDSRGTEVIYPLDITKEEVREHIDGTLNYYTSRGMKFIHLDHLSLLFSRTGRTELLMDPRQKLHLLLDILAPFRKRGIRFSASGLPITGQIEIFDVIFSDLSRDWHGYAELINLAVSLKNPPPLSLGGLMLAPAGKKTRENKKREIFLHTQALLNGPSLLADRTEDLDESLLMSWKERTGEITGTLMPLEISEIGLMQDVLLLINRQRMMAVLNLSRKTRIVSLKEGELAGGRGYSPSDSTSLKSRELILKMNRESSHFFKV